MKKALSTKNIARIGILASIGAILMVLDFPISFIAPSFYKLDISDIPCLIGSFAMGVVPAIFIEIIKILLKMLIKPTSTAFAGEITSLLVSLSLIVPAGMLYKKHKDKKNAYKAIIISSLIMILVSSCINYVFSIPFYVSFYGMPEQAIIGMGSEIIPIIKDRLSFVLLCVVPFNLIKAIILDILTILLYKRISPLLRDN